MLDNKGATNLSFGMGANAEVIDVSVQDYTPSGNNKAFTLYVGTGGDIKIDTLEGDTVPLVGIIGGTFPPVLCKKVYTTGTTASDLVALW